LKAIRDKIINKHIESALFDLSEKRILDYIADSNINSGESFTSRLVQTVRALCAIPTGSPQIQVAVSEILHTKEIGQMQEMLCEYIESANLEHFCILIDGLDANWKMGEDYDIISDILLALIGAARDIWRDCSKSIRTKGNWKGASIAIFIRSDVFEIALERARDPDKLQFESLSWPNVESLINVVFRRLLVSSGKDEEDVFNWTEMLEPGFDYNDMKTILLNNVLPRPRDYLYYFQRVIYFTRSRGTKYITKRDFQSALDEYSQWVLLSLSAEAQPYIPNMMDLLLDFDRKRAVLSVEEINKILMSSGVNEKDLRRALNFLLEINFLGYGIDANNYRFPSSPAEETIVKRSFLRQTKGDYTTGFFKIHNAFHSVLSIQ
jgi:hypothetical protein